MRGAVRERSDERHRQEVVVSRRVVGLIAVPVTSLRVDWFAVRIPNKPPLVCLVAASQPHAVRVGGGSKS